jgi:hypothetical protein
MTDLAFMTMAEASRLIRARKLSPVELTAALLARIAALDGVYHAYIAVTAEIALAQAKAAEAEIMAGTFRGPLHGVPYALKDLFDVAGIDDLPLQAAQEPSRGGGCDRGRPAARGRRGTPRQARFARIRHRRPDPRIAMAAGAQSVGP